MTVAVSTKNAPSETYDVFLLQAQLHQPTAMARLPGRVLPIQQATQATGNKSKHPLQCTFISLLLQKISPLFVWALKKNNHFFSPSMATYWNQSLQQFKAAFLSSHPSVASCNTWRVADRIYPANYLIPSLTVHVLKKKWLSSVRARCPEHKAYYSTKKCTEENNFSETLITK